MARLSSIMGNDSGLRKNKHLSWYANAANLLVMTPL